MVRRAERRSDRADRADQPLAPMLACVRCCPCLRRRAATDRQRRLDLRLPRLSGMRDLQREQVRLRGFTEALRRELAGSRIRVMHLAPRSTRTALNSDAMYALNDGLGVAVDDPEVVADALLRAARLAASRAPPRISGATVRAHQPAAAASRGQGLRRQLPHIQRQRGARPRPVRPPTSSSDAINGSQPMKRLATLLARARGVARGARGHGRRRAQAAGRLGEHQVRCTESRPGEVVRGADAGRGRRARAIPDACRTDDLVRHHRCQLRGREGRAGRAVDRQGREEIPRGCDRRRPQRPRRICLHEPGLAVLPGARMAHRLRRRQEGARDARDGAR